MSFVKRVSKGFLKEISGKNGATDGYVTYYLLPTFNVFFSTNILANFLSLTILSPRGIQTFHIFKKKSLEFGEQEKDLPNRCERKKLLTTFLCFL